MTQSLESTFARLLSTKYDQDLEDEAIAILEGEPEIAKLEWTGADKKGDPFVKGSTALHYAANDGKLNLVRRLVEFGADVNASNANWYRSVLAWAANNARTETIEYLLSAGADPLSLDAMHAAAYGGSTGGKKSGRDYVLTLQILLDAGADIDDRRHFEQTTPLSIAISSGNEAAIEFLRSQNAST